MLRKPLDLHITLAPWPQGRGATYHLFRHRKLLVFLSRYDPGPGDWEASETGATPAGFARSLKVCKDL